jgi:predicted Rossmann-fold nucleotide-binding protein
MPEKLLCFEKIISGGQTGVDRAALDVALELDIPCGGWCPKRRRAEDGRIPQRYHLKETASTSYPVRTEMNVSDSDGTLILTWGSPTGGTATTLKLAKKFKKPYLVVDLSKNHDPLFVTEWAKTNKVKVLNVAGPRESKTAGIHDMAVEFLWKVFR